MHAALAASLLMAGLALAAAGVNELKNLHAVHEVAEVRRASSAQVLRTWLAGLDPSDRENAHRLARRLVYMTMPQRRAAVHAISDADFVQSLTGDRQRQRGYEVMLLAGTRGALSSAPALADLWYLAARLNSRLSGFDSTTQRYLELSYLYGPREIGLVTARLQLAGLAWPLLSANLKAHARRDLEVASHAFPDRAKAFADYLKAGGATF